MNITLDLRAPAQATARHCGLDFEDLQPALRRAALATWRGRMMNEYGSCAVFEGLADQLEAAGGRASDVEILKGFAQEEREHGVLCGAVVEALGGAALGDQPLPTADEMPAHAGLDPLEAVARNIISVCCLSETVAVSLITAERLGMPEGPLRRLLTRILSDEVGHGRFGWRWLAEHLPWMSAESRARLGEWLPMALRHLEAYEVAHLQPGPSLTDGHMLGLCDGEAAQALFYDTVRTVILPRLEALGLPPVNDWAEAPAC
ncbi:MAG: ferritin-like domain-containing protein [Bradymonadia bacterium]